MQFGLRRGLLIITAIAFLMWANLPVSELTEDYDVGPPAEFNPVRSFLFMRGWPVPIWSRGWGDILGWHIKERHFWGILAFNTSVQVLIAGGIILLPESFIKTVNAKFKSNSFEN